MIGIRLETKLLFNCYNGKFLAWSLKIAIIVYDYDVSCKNLKNFLLDSLVNIFMNQGYYTMVTMFTDPNKGFQKEYENNTQTMRQTVQEIFYNKWTSKNFQERKIEIWSKICKNTWEICEKQIFVVGHNLQLITLFISMFST